MRIGLWCLRPMVGSHEEKYIVYCLKLWKTIFASNLNNAFEWVAKHDYNSYGVYIVSSRPCLPPQQSHPAPCVCGDAVAPRFLCVHIFKTNNYSHSAELQSPLTQNAMVGVVLRGGGETRSNRPNRKAINIFVSQSRVYGSIYMCALCARSAVRVLRRPS